MSIEALKKVRDFLRNEARKHDHCGEIRFPSPDEIPFYRFPTEDSKKFDEQADAIDAEIRRMEGGHVYGYAYGNRFWEKGNPRLPDDAKEYGTKLYTHPAPRAGVPDGWRPKDAEVQAWMDRNDIDGRSVFDMRTAIDDARSMHMLAATPHDPSSQGGEVE